MKQYVKRTQRDYPLSFKLSVVEQVEKGEMFQSVHEKHGLICSMTDGYPCYQNSLAERVNGILKK